MILNAHRDFMVERKPGAIKVNDTCEVCPNPAYVIAKKDDKTLMFCLHDGKTHAPLLAAKDWEIEDNTHLLIKDYRKPVDETPLEIHKSDKKDDGGAGVLAKATS